MINNATGKRFKPFFVFVLSVFSQLLVASHIHAQDSFSQLSVPNGVANLEWRSNFSQQEKQFLMAWLSKATHTASQLAGSFPREQSRIRIERASARRSGSRWPVPWGQTLRRGLDGVLFQVNTAKPLQEFVDDWTAAHEFSHLFIPYPGQRDIWLSEGFASYYQNILMAREGILTEQRAWQKLYEGYMRAEGDKNGNYTLNQVSEERRRFRSTMRVYWSGALFFMEADIALRLATKNQRSLDWVLNEYIDCCREQRNTWNGEQMLTSFDQVIAADPVLQQSMDKNYFSQLYQTYSQSRKIPDCEPLFKKIGIDIVDENVQLNGDVEMVTLRRDFTQSRLEPLDVKMIKLD